MDKSTLDALVDGKARHGSAFLIPTTESQGTSRSADDVVVSARRLAAALVEYGLEPGTELGIVAPWGGDAVLGTLAAAAAGAVPVLVDVLLGDEPLRRALASATHVLVGDTSQMNRVVSARPDLPDLEVVLVFRPERDDRPSPAMSVEAACARGADILQTDALLLVEQKARRPAAAPALGLAMAGSRPIRVARDELAERVAAVAAAVAPRDDDVVLARAPVPTGTLLATTLACLDRGVALIPDAGAEPIEEVFGSFRPTVAVVSPDDLDQTHRLLTAAIASRGWTGRRSARWAIRQGLASTRRAWAHGLAETVALRGLRERLGGRLRLLAVVGGAATGEAAEFLRALGIEVLAIPPWGPDVGSTLAKS